MTLWIGFATIFLVYMCTCLPDTKGKTFEEIQKALNGSLIKRNIKFSKSKSILQTEKLEKIECKQELKEMDCKVNFKSTSLQKAQC